MVGLQWKDAVVDKGVIMELGGCNKSLCRSPPPKGSSASNKSLGSALKIPPWGAVGWTAVGAATVAAAHSGVPSGVVWSINLNLNSNNVDVVVDDDDKFQSIKCVIITNY